MANLITCPNGHIYDRNKYSSCPECAGKTVPVTNPFDNNATEYVNNGAQFGPIMPNEDDATLPHVYPTADAARPVVGWLVCIQGPSRGTDYRIFPGFNSIGRASTMDIVIEGDEQISREREARIAFDTESRTFYFSPAEGKSILRVNSKVAMVPIELQPYDEITIGATKLLFVPLCGDKFNWDE